MSILLCSHNSSVLNRWSNALQEDWTIVRVSSVQELAIRLRKGGHTSLLLHRSMVDEQQLKEITQSDKVKKIFVLSDRPDDAEGLLCLQLGCVGYANTYLSPDKLKAGLEALESGLIWVGASLMRKLIRGLPSSDEQRKVEDNSQATTVLDSLTPREFQIARLVADGLHNLEIAGEIGVAERTVKAHLSKIYSKTSTKGRLQLALLFGR
ncbi:response regulator transcription factor [Desulforhopalus sp. 52FAK]